MLHAAGPLAAVSASFPPRADVRRPPDGATACATTIDGFFANAWADPALVAATAEPAALDDASVLVVELDRVGGSM